MNVNFFKDGNAMYVWVKMFIEEKDKQAAFYKHSPGYRFMAKQSNGLVYGFKRVLDQQNPIPHHLELCNEEEIAKLEKLDEDQNHQSQNR